jgi:hypothetical protein
MPGGKDRRDPVSVVGRGDGGGPRDVEDFTYKAWLFDFDGAPGLAAEMADTRFPSK